MSILKIICQALLLISATYKETIAVDDNCTLHNVIMNVYGLSEGAIIALMEFNGMRDYYLLNHPLYKFPMHVDKISQGESYLRTLLNIYYSSNRQEGKHHTLKEFTHQLILSDRLTL